ncbi:glutathione S-transferase [Glomus cerebriforme]|uniref:glutathione transferase n=1 Tax=Glomus cerebriforme TaxID=658196 RepID=A0A397SE12_9GLOM|nr:glutathione S-transferase [Glomus cerebriforme]
MTIQLIGYPASTFTLIVIATLEELGIPFELTPLTNFADIKTPEYLATKHPFGMIPVLIDDGFKLYESRAIARYLVNKYQGTKNSTVLIPSDVQKAALVNQYISVETSYFTDPLKKLFYQEIFSKRHGQPVDPEIIKVAREEINKVLDVYEKLLEGKDYLTGEFSLADIVHYPYTQYAVNSGHGDLFNDPKRPNVARWWKIISEREAWKKVISENKFFD